MAGKFKFSFGPWNIHEGADPFGGSSEQFGAHIKAEIERWGKVIRASGARPD